MQDRASEGQPIRLLTLIDEYVGECPSIDVGRGLKSEDVLERWTRLLVTRGVPDHIHSDSGPEFTAQ